MVGLLATGAGIFGSLIGSFLNVVIFRVPAGRSIVAPPSACGGCSAPIRPWDNIPVLSWLLLRGRCRDCQIAISPRYPLVELGTAVFFAVIALRFGSAMTDPSLLVGTVVTVLGYLYLGAISVALALIDIDTRKLPNAIVLPSYPVAAVLLATAALLASEPGRIATALIGATCLFGIYLLLALIYPGGMGYGDVKLAGVLGLYLGWLGWEAFAVGAFAAFLLGGVFSLILVALRRANLKSGIPFGPWMIGGAWVGILGGEQLASEYLSLFGVG
ncbi:prepilin peptidase [Mycetocola sp.]|uniref:prepilin peptidase n=1 Tax=Mycetocola sp. TaxID=1871042 RepID=UPI003989D8DA